MPRTPPAVEVIDRPLTPETGGEAVSRATAIVDGAGRVRAVSSGFTAALRVRRDELLAQPLSAAVDQEDRPALAHALQAVASGEWPGCAIEVRFLQHGRPARSVRLLLAPDGPQRVRAHATDLSAEREASQTLQQYEGGLRALTAHALDIWALLDEAGAMRSVSVSVATHLGWTPQELDGRALRDFTHPEDHERVSELLHALKADPAAVRTFMFRARHKDGEWRTLESTASGFNPDVLGNSVFVLNARDVTARQRTEAALRESEYRFGQLVQQALAGIVVVQQGRIVYANPRFLALTGLDESTIAGRPRALPLVDRSSIPAVRQVRAELAMGAGRSSHVRLRGRHASGGAGGVDHHIVGLVEVHRAAVQRAYLGAALDHMRDPFRSACHVRPGRGAVHRFGPVELQVAPHPGGQVQHHIGAAVADALGQFAVQGGVAGGLAGLGVAHVAMHHRRTGLGLDGRCGDLGRAARHMGAAVLRAARSGHGTGDENLAVHGQRHGTLPFGAA